MKNIIKIQEEVMIEQDDRKVILEKGDKIRVLEMKYSLNVDSEERGYKKVATLKSKNLKDAKKEVEKMVTLWDKEFEDYSDAYDSWVDAGEKGREPRFKSKVIPGLEEGGDVFIEDDEGNSIFFTGDNSWEEFEGTMIKEDVMIEQDDKRIILEKGDRIRVIQEKSKAYQKYLDFVDKEGHITASASSVFEDWIDKKGKSLSLDDIKNALDDLWSRSDSESKYNLINYAIKKGIK